MSISIFKKIRIFLTRLVGILFFILMPYAENKHGIEVTYIDSFFVGLLIYVSLSLLWSDWLYNQYKEEDYKINYTLYQMLGIGTAVFAITISVGSISEEFFGFGITIFRALLIAFIVTFLIYYFFNKKQNS